MDYSAVVKDLKDKGIILGDDFVGYRINPYLEMPKSLSFDDVAIQQGKNVCASRLDTSIKAEVARGLTLAVPLVAANMSAVTNAEMCIELNKEGALGILHRAWPVFEDYLLEVKKVAFRTSLAAASVGAGPNALQNTTKLVKAGARVVVIDIAQGYSDMVTRTAAAIRREFSDLILIVGNTINPEMMYEVDKYASAVKVGIAQGSVCETKNTAGATEKQWSAVMKFKEVSRKLGLPVISDGSVSEPAHFVKAIAAGANSVMAGRIFARCPESAADTVEVDGVSKKMYFGMASREAQRRWRGGIKPGTCPEGKTSFLDIGEPVAALVERYSGALRSGITYAGARDIDSFQKKVKFVRL